jgi:hypothetical protein
MKTGSYILLHIIMKSLHIQEIFLVQYSGINYQQNWLSYAYTFSRSKKGHQIPLKGKNFSPSHVHMLCAFREFILVRWDYMKQQYLSTLMCSRRLVKLHAYSFDHFRRKCENIWLNFTCESMLHQLSNKAHIDTIGFWWWCITHKDIGFSDFVHRPDFS